MAAAQRAADDDDTVRGGLRIDAERGEAVRHDLDAVGLLHAQLGGAVQHGAPLRAGGGDEQGRAFVDRPRDEVFGDVDTAQRRAAHAQIGHGLAADLALGQDLDIGAHAFEDLDRAGARGVPADMLQHDIAAGRDGRAHEKEGRRGHVRGHIDGAGGQAPTAAHADRAPASLQRIAEAFKHALGMVAALARLMDTGRPLRVEPGQQEGRLDLGTGDRGGVVHPPERAPAAEGQRRCAVPAGGDGRAHLRQRLSYPAHRPARQRGIAGQGRAERLGGEQAGEQAHRGARIAQIDGPVGRAQAADADAVDDHAAGIRSVDGHAQAVECGHGGERVGALEEPLDPRDAVGQRAQHDGAMRDGLVARHAGAAHEAAPRLDVEGRGAHPQKRSRAAFARPNRASRPSASPARISAVSWSRSSR